jgi:hypothetical protein
MGNGGCRHPGAPKVRDVLRPARMPTDRMTPEPPTLHAMPGASEWLALADDLLAGLVHALNNRITALSVCVELAGFGDEQMVKDGMLAVEIGRLQRAGALVGLIPARGQPEALEIAPVLDDALAIHAHHPRMRGIECSAGVLGSPPPVRVPRWALLRLLLILVDEAKSAARESEQTAVTIELSGDERVLCVRAPARTSVGAYATAMATLCGGTLDRDDDDVVLTLPGLSEVRLREREARSSG